MIETLNLAGSWRLKQMGKRTSLPALVPGQVHLDLIADKKIKDPFYRDHEEDLHWIGEADWEYSRSFIIPASFLKREKILLQCDGLDTLATITLNGKQLAKTDNMFRRYEFEVKSFLKPGKNSIAIHLASPLPYIRKKEKKFHLPTWGGLKEVKGRAYVRKEPCNFGWDWGPIMVTCGIWRPIQLVAYDTARIQNLRIEQNHWDRSSKVDLDITTEIDRTGRKSLKVHVAVYDREKLIAKEEQTIPGKQSHIRLTLKRPKLWWPAGMGDQSLYEVKVRLEDPEGNLLDLQEKRIGIRTLNLVRKKDSRGESFQFEANGIPFFAKGANWIPADTFVCRLRKEDYAYLLKSAVLANMNMLRVWGGGIYEEDSFYDLCDELGITIWQDFMFACSTYPTFDREFMANVKAEAEDNIRRLRHHACLALWCGNNELEQGLVQEKWTENAMASKDYDKLFNQILPQLVETLDSGRAYWPSSPHAPEGELVYRHNDRCGDVHEWRVWHRLQPFEFYRTYEYRFCSEFGFQSFPEPKTVRNYTNPQDRNITSHIMEHHQRSPIGNTTIMTYLLDWFRMPNDFESTLWLSQILQGTGVKYAVEHWRRAAPRCMGTLYWQLNDCWPVAGWASLDYYGRWKALHYMAKRFFSPILLSAVEDSNTASVEVYVTSDLQKSQKSKLTWTLTDVEGKQLEKGSKVVPIPKAKSKKVDSLDFSKHLATHSKRDLILWLELEVDGKIVSSNIASFARPKHLELIDPLITSRIQSQKDGSYIVKIQGKHPALWVWLELAQTDAQFSDNFFHLPAGKSIEVKIRPSKPIKKDQLQKRLKICSLVNTY